MSGDVSVDIMREHGFDKLSIAKATKDDKRKSEYDLQYNVTSNIFKDEYSFQELGRTSSETK